MMSPTGASVDSMGRVGGAGAKGCFLFTVRAMGSAVQCCHDRESFVGVMTVQLW